MHAALSTSALQSYLNKMDNVLYEIKDHKGILKNNNYDAWKVEVIADLASSGFIEQKGDLYVITAEGREVIRHDSFLYYNRRIKLSKGEVPVENAPTVERVSIFRSKITIGLFIIFLLAILASAGLFV